MDLRGGSRPSSTPRGSARRRRPLVRVEDHRAPQWPDSAVPRRFHPDFAVGDLHAAEARLLEPGAGEPDHQPGHDRWRVRTDPAGHPFCLVRD
ncbi:VOC family protein [Marinactinospora rubrisoli]|uniref:VOC family protein n=1 Tax=Marinactinospora rubrisoli TaxID=2715399 RepID=A0ABW2KFT5_9ACTN